MELECTPCQVKFIKRIFGEVVTTRKKVDIDLDSKNLILVGKNGSGKTSFLTSLHAVLTANIVEGQSLRLDAIRRDLENYEIALIDNPGFQSTVDHYRSMIKANSYPLEVSYTNVEQFVGQHKAAKSIVRNYEATRKIQINKVKAATPLKSDVPQHEKGKNFGVNLEQHLVNLQVGMGLAMLKGDSEKIERVKLWFKKFEDDLRFLFEDETLYLEFSDEKLSFELSQEGRPNYTFQSLSSGYLAIFDIYADLLVRGEYYDILPSEMSGVVLIDEIDAHLHMSLQRKILPFLTRSFPGIQFIVTTHSPFVVTSIDDSLIYDISSGRACEDLTMFSLEHVVEAIHGVPPISQRMQDLIANLIMASDNDEVSVEYLGELLSQISPYLDTLDDESQMFYQIARNKYLARKTGRSNNV